MTIQEWAEAKIGNYESAGFPHVGKVLSYKIVEGTNKVKFTCQNIAVDPSATIIATKKFLRKFEKMNLETFKAELKAETEDLDSSELSIL